jgi:kinesin family protein 2/24
MQRVKVTEMPLVSYQQLEAQYGSNVDRICNDHEKLVEMILEEEEELIGSHRQHIDDVVDLVKQEMMILHDVDKPGSDLEEYVSALDAILMHKMDLIGVVRQRLIDFYSHLKMEENLQKLYQ